jgi:hypothetical protein
LSTPDEFHDFFVASAGVAGALVGLLFVAVSVTLERLEEHGHTQIHRVRARAALMSFTNALAVSLYALIPEEHLGWAAFVVAIVGSLFVIGALLSLWRLVGRRPGELANALFLIGLEVVFVIQLLAGLSLIHNPHQTGAYQTLCVLIVVCFLIGVSRSWELIGGPNIAVGREIRALARRDHGDRAGGGAEQSDE